MYNHILLTGCNGTIKVFVGTHTISTYSDKLTARTPSRTKRNIKKKDPKTREFLRFRFAKIEGDCEWVIHSKPRNLGGYSKMLRRPTTHESDFDIKSVTLRECLC